MTADFVYNGIPIEKDGIVIGVLPVRGIEAANGALYRGVLGVDSRGNEFVYRRYPATREPPATNTLFFLDTLPRQPDTRYIILSDGIIEADKILMA